MHAVPQAWQLFTSEVGSEQTPEQQLSPVAQAALPQPPQFADGSDVVLVQTWLQQVGDSGDRPASGCVIGSQSLSLPQPAAHMLSVPQYSPNGQSDSVVQVCIPDVQALGFWEQDEQVPVLSQ
jgi:hypothetical protein